MGVFDFDSTARVELSSNGVEFWRSVAFDAVKFVPVGYTQVNNKSNLGDSTAAETAPGVEWEKTFGGADYDVGNCVQQTSDGGYIICGYNSNFDFWLIKTNSDGNKQWDKTYGEYSGEAESVLQTTDGGYAFVGGNWISGDKGDLKFFKTDLNGNEQWDKTYGGANYWDNGYSVQQTTDEGYIITGDTGTYGAGSKDVWLIKTNSNGNKQWDMTFGGTDWDEGRFVQQTSDGGYILTGYTCTSAGSYDAYLIT